MKCIGNLLATYCLGLITSVGSLFFIVDLRQKDSRHCAGYEEKDI
ncbi:MAG: hypothetical protein RR396_04655 [Clostridiales bacterium]